MNTQVKSQKIVKYLTENYIPPLGSIDLFLTHDCNFYCDYCFVGEKRLDYMSEETAIRGVNLLFKESKNLPSVGIVFFGGEPLMNIGVLKVAIDHAERMGKFYRKKINFGITTNGALLSEDICEYLKEKNMFPLISIDGSEESHNRHRVYADGSGTFQDVLRGIRNIYKTHGHVGVRMTVSPESLNLLYDDVLWLYRTVGVSTFIICHNTDVDWTDHEINYYLHESDRINQLFLSEQKQFKGFHLQDNTSLANQIDRGKFSQPCSAGTSAVAVSTDGKLYACSRFVRENIYCIGTVDEGRILNQNFKEILSYKKKPKKECYSCKIEHICNGGCIAVNYEQTGDIKKKSDRDCKIHSGQFSMLIENNELLRLARNCPASGSQSICVY